MTWDQVCLALERAHPCMCGPSIAEADRGAVAYATRLRFHLFSCPKRKMLDVLTAAMRELPEDINNV